MTQIRRERNGSVTLLDIHDGAGCERQLNIHGFRAGQTTPTLSLAVLDSQGRLCGAAHLDPEGIRELLGVVAGMI